jgi:glycosyltransferase involved in cell wall biosynthesis
VKLLGRAKLSIGLNISDGTPNTMLESMMMGAFPIQSDTISTREWITDGVNGLLVDPDDPDDLAKAIRRSIDDTDLLESAASANTAEIGEKLQREEVSKKVVHIYRAVLEDEI